MAKTITIPDKTGELQQMIEFLIQTHQKEHFIKLKKAELLRSLIMKEYSKVNQNT